MITGRAHRVGALPTEMRERERGHLLSSCMTLVLHTSRNSNVEVVMVNDSYIHRFVFFKLVDKCDKDEIINITRTGDKEKI